MRNKRWLYTVVALVGALAALPSALSARTLSLTPKTAGMGSLVAVPLHIDEAEGICGFEADVVYDTATLTLQGIDRGGILPVGWTLSHNVVSPGRVRVVGFMEAEEGHQSLPAGEGDLALLNLKVSKPAETGPSVLALQGVVVGDAEGLPLAVDTLDGSVTVTAEVSISIMPDAPRLNLGASGEFTAVVANGATGAVRWTLSDPATMGTITPIDGSRALYTAPSVMPNANEAIINAQSLDDEGKWAYVVVTLLPAVSVQVTPPSVTLQAGSSQLFTASVTNDEKGLGVTWEVVGGDTKGTVTADGLYSAPEYVSETTIVTLRATSVAVPSVSGTASITVKPNVKGDVDGDGVTRIDDVMWVLSCILALRVPDASEAWAGDMDSNGVLNVLDIILMIRQMLGIS